MATPILSTFRRFSQSLKIQVLSQFFRAKKFGYTFSLKNSYFVNYTLRIHLFSRTKRSALLSAIGITTADASHSENGKSFEPDDARLRSHECLKNAAGLSVDSTSAVLSQTVYALTKIEEQYVELVDALVQLIDYQLEVLGHKAEEERIGDIIMEARHELNKVKRRKDDLQLLFTSVEKLADATAEVAFAAGVEYGSTCAGERLYSAQTEVQRVQAKSRDADKRLAEVQAKSIELLAQHEDKEKQGVTNLAESMEVLVEELKLKESLADSRITEGVCDSEDVLEINSAADEEDDKRNDNDNDLWIRDTGMSDFKEENEDWIKD